LTGGFLHLPDPSTGQVTPRLDPRWRAGSVCLDRDPKRRAFQGEEKYLRVALSLGPDWRVYTDEGEAGL
jgi:hypothetical protein